MKMKKLVAKLFIALVVVSGVPTIDWQLPTWQPAALASGFYNVYRIPANSTDTHRVWLNRGHADIEISGDGDTDLDLYVLNGDGSLAIRREVTAMTNQLYEYYPQPVISSLKSSIAALFITIINSG